MLSEDITLIKSSPGGSRAHAIVINKDGSYSYKIASQFIDSPSFTDKSLQIDTTYQVLSGIITENQKITLQRFIKEHRNSKLNSNSAVIKDAWQLHLFIDGKKIFKIYEPSLADEPRDMQEIIRLIMSMPQKTYDLPGFS